MKNINKKVMLGVIAALGLSTSAHATGITTGNLSATTTAASPQVSNINAPPAAIIRLDVGGAAYLNTTSPLSVTITVDTATPSVTVGTAAD